MKKRKETLIELIRKNKEELLNDKAEIERIEERLEAKHEKRIKVK
ncbi:Fur-regulated basic protein B [Mesobacillus persicus]|uniref:Fur-regulated basic protein B n=1 Tax=Mesobacillus persicus TaxID=930146 RepID=A0A1H8CPN1_9BACI|nr:FbpB family small basic protein [Mesobacillus persicus]SEM96842.1 Fur-regulated basic protein B [Mesobacillus persicus]